MQRYIQISRYHVAIIATYALAVAALWRLSPNLFTYGFSNGNLGPVLWVCISSLLAFFAYLHIFRQKEIKIQLNHIFASAPLLILYALYFAAAEEIVFRGLVQNYLETQLGDMTLAVLATSIVFGAVHLPNGARGLSYRLWNWQFAGIAFMGGLVLGSLYALTGTLLIPTLLHTFFLFILILKATRVH